jgi:hypothetical protein
VVCKLTTSCMFKVARPCMQPAPQNSKRHVHTVCRDNTGQEKRTEKRPEKGHVSATSLERCSCSLIQRTSLKEIISVHSNNSVHV